MFHGQLNGVTMSTIKDVISEYANKENVSPIRARNDLIKNGILMELTVEKYAKLKQISKNSARKLLNDLCEISPFNGIKIENVIVGHRVSKRHSKTSLVPKYGNVYIVME